MTTSAREHSRALFVLLGTWCVSLASISLIGCELSDESPATTDSPPATPGPAPGTTVPPLAAPPISLDSHQAVGSMHWADGDSSSGGQGQPVAGLECVFPSPITYHAHAHLSILLNGAALAVPRHVGIVALTPTTECHYPLHTHDSTGIIHLHATSPTDFTLGQFFSIWGEPLERSNIAGLVGLPAVVYVVDDGVASEYTGDLATLQLIERRQITIQVGTPIATIPQFVWTGD